MTRALRALVAALLLAAALAWGTSSPAVAGPGERAAEIERAIFTGTFVGTPEITGVGEFQVRVYRVTVSQVFGPTDVPSQRVRVRARVALEGCTAAGGGESEGDSGQTDQNDPGPAGQQQAGEPDQSPSPSSDPPQTQDPTPSPTVDRQLRLFNATVQDDLYVVAGCGSVAIASETALTSVEERYGEGRPPGAPVEPAPDELDPVDFLCPDTRDTVSDLGDDSCDALAGNQSFDRTAAPGLALVIVGVLGLVVARRVGRRRT